MRIIFIFFITLNSYFSFSQHLNYENKSKELLLENKFDSAAVYTQKIIQNLDTSKDKFKRAEYYIQYARILKSISKSDSCFYYLNKAESILLNQKNKYAEKLFYILALKAETCRYLGKRDLAINYIYQATKKQKPFYDPDVIAYFENRKMAIVAEYYNNVPDSVKVVHALAKSIFIKEKLLKDKSLVAYTYNEIGYLDFNINIARALKNFKLAFDVANKYKCKMALADVALNLGRIYQQKFFDLKKAIYYHNISALNAKDIDNYWQIKEAYINLKICYALNKDFQKALFYGDSVSSYQAKIIEKENAIVLDEIEKKYNFAKKDSELKTSKENSKYLIIILIIITLGFFVVFYFNNKIRENNKQLTLLNEENEFLLSETNHRINNNLQLIVILISDEIRKLDEKNSSHIKKILSKVESIATLHRHLYQTKNKSEVEISSYLTEIRINFNEIFKENDVEINFEIDKNVLSIDQGMYLGLLLTELFINSLKHAFQANQVKVISVAIKNTAKGYDLYYSDNGINAIDKTIKPILVEKLCRQLKVTPQITTEEGFSLYLKKES